MPKAARMQEIHHIQAGQMVIQLRHERVYRRNIIHKILKHNETEKMANRADRASVKAHGSVRRRLPPLHCRTDGVKQLHGSSQILPSSLREIKNTTTVCHSRTWVRGELWMEWRLLPRQEPAQVHSGDVLPLS